VYVDAENIPPFPLVREHRSRDRAIASQSTQGSRGRALDRCKSSEDPLISEINQLLQDLKPSLKIDKSHHPAAATIPTPWDELEADPKSASTSLQVGHGISQIDMLPTLPVASQRKRPVVRNYEEFQLHFRNFVHRMGHQIYFEHEVGHFVHKSVEELAAIAQAAPPGPFLLSPAPASA